MKAETMHTEKLAPCRGSWLPVAGCTPTGANDHALGMMWGAGGVGSPVEGPWMSPRGLLLSRWDNGSEQDYLSSLLGLVF